MPYNLGLHIRGPYMHILDTLVERLEGKMEISIDIVDARRNFRIAYITQVSACS